MATEKTPSSPTSHASRTGMLKASKRSMTMLVASKAVLDLESGFHASQFQEDPEDSTESMSHPGMGCLLRHLAREVDEVVPLLLERSRERLHRSWLTYSLRMSRDAVDSLPPSSPSPPSPAACCSPAVPSDDSEVRLENIRLSNGGRPPSPASSLAPREGGACAGSSL
mmetsp:Transcript_19619/g.53916  ORF Transcript_19619/g.53916 Transcript_19619/m.53916 type:complete len:168 (-) Transcript_19619:360-863(-)